MRDLEEERREFIRETAQRLLASNTYATTISEDALLANVERAWQYAKALWAAKPGDC